MLLPMQMVLVFLTFFPVFVVLVVVLVSLLKTMFDLLAVNPDNLARLNLCVLGQN